MYSGSSTVHPTANGAAWRALEDVDGTDRAAVVYTLDRELETAPYALVAWVDGEPVALVASTRDEHGPYVVAWEGLDDGRRYCRTYRHPSDAMRAVTSSRIYVNVRLLGHSPELDGFEWRA